MTRRCPFGYGQLTLKQSLSHGSDWVLSDQVGTKLVDLRIGLLDEAQAELKARREGALFALVRLASRILAVTKFGFGACEHLLAKRKGSTCSTGSTRKLRFRRAHTFIAIRRRWSHPEEEGS